MFLGLGLALPRGGIVGPWGGYSSALAALLTEAQTSGLVLDFTQNIAFRAGTSSTITGVSGWTYTRSGTRFAGDSALTSFGANVPRIVAGSGIRVTAGATNLLLRSAEFDDAQWQKIGGASVNANQVAAPDGTLTADRILLPTGGATSQLFQSQPITAGPITQSIWLRADAPLTVRYGFFDDAIDASDISVTTQWQRFTRTRAGGFAGADRRASWLYYNGTADTTPLYAWGAQLETGSTATDYIPTTTASATAGADAASVTGLTFSGAHSVIALTGVKGAAGAELVYQMDDGSNNNRSVFYRVSGNVNALMTSGGVLQTDNGMGTWTASAQKIAGRFNTNDVRAAVDGVAGVADTTATLPVGTLSRFQIGSNPTLPINGLIQLLAILPRALSDTELQNGTA